MKHITDTEATIIRAAAQILDDVNERLTAASFAEHDDRTALRRLIVTARDAEHAAAAVRSALTSFEVRLADETPEPAEPQSLRVQP